MRTRCESQTRKLGPTKPRPMKQKPNKPPIKVVYISNPMRVNATAAQFRALVQRLTGRDSEVPQDPTEYEDGSGGARVAAEVAVGDDVSKEGIGKSSSSSGSVEATSSCEVGDFVGCGGGARECYGDDFLMDGHDGLFPVLGSEAFLWTWMC